MGSGWGGRRAGAGRKRIKLRVVPPADPVVVEPAGINVEPEAPVVVRVGAFTAPEDFTAAEQKVWARLAPYAIAQSTLTTATALGFELLCRNIVLERVLGRDPDTRGGPNHRGLIASIDRELLRFDLSPTGRPHSAAAGVKKPLSKLDELKAKRASLHAIG